MQKTIYLFMVIFAFFNMHAGDDIQIRKNPILDTFNRKEQDVQSFIAMLKAEIKEMQEAKELAMNTPKIVKKKKAKLSVKEIQWNRK